MTHPNDFETTTAPTRGDGQESSLRKINKILNSIVTVTGTAVTSFLAFFPRQWSTAPSNEAVSTTTGTVFTLAAGEMGVIVNCGTNPIQVKLGASASSSSFNFLLAAGASNDDGTGGTLVIDDYVGVVSVAGTSARFMAWKR